MNRKRAMTLFAFCMVGLLTFTLLSRAASLFTKAERKPAREVAPGQLELRISTEKLSLNVGELPHLKTSITNRGDRSVLLVQPGDGSESAMRTPIIGWSIVSLDEQNPFKPKGQARCGNVNSLRTDEIFELRPGETKELIGVFSISPFRSPGTYEVRLKYQNDPTHQWSPLAGAPDPAAFEQLRQTTRCTLESNELTLTVK